MDKGKLNSLRFYGQKKLEKSLNTRPLAMSFLSGFDWTFYSGGIEGLTDSYLSLPNWLRGSSGEVYTSENP